MTEDLLRLLNQHMKVEYIFEEDARPIELPDEDPAEDNLSDSLARTDVKWREDLKRAAKRMEVEKTMEVIKRLGEDRQALARALTGMVRGYRFKQLKAILEGIED